MTEELADLKQHPDSAQVGTVRVLVLSVTHGNPSLEEISLSDEQFWPIYPSLAEIPPVTDSTSDVCRDPSLMECTATRYCTVDLLWYHLQRSFSISNLSALGR